MSDKHMDEVITEFKAKFKYGDEHCKFSGADLLSHIPKACRSYARKVVEEMLKEGTCCSLEDPVSQRANSICVKEHEFDLMIDRLTDKEPTSGKAQAPKG